MKNTPTITTTVLAVPSHFVPCLLSNSGRGICLSVLGSTSSLQVCLLFAARGRDDFHCLDLCLVFLLHSELFSTGAAFPCFCLHLSPVFTHPYVVSNFCCLPPPAVSYSLTPSFPSCGCFGARLSSAGEFEVIPAPWQH